MRPLAWLLRLGAIVVAGALLTTAVVVAVGPRVWRVANAHVQYPVSLPEFQSLSQRSYVYDVVGNVIAVFERENSQPITLAQVPPEVLSAFLAVEDEQFYLHHGVNLRGFARALLSNFSSDAPRQGASTISQQVVKNEFLAGLPRDGRYKGLQAHYATMLEKKMSKDAILERYLNTVFFGNNAYGLQAAAEVYFGKNVGELTMIEGAFLAGLVRSPSGFDPIRHSERARARFRQVTERLSDVGLVTPLVGSLLGSTWKMPERVRTIPTLHDQADLLHRSDQGVPAEAGDVPRRRAAARQPAVSRRSGDPLDVRPQPAGPRRTGPRGAAEDEGRHRERHLDARHQDGSDPGDGRRQRVPTARQRDQHGARATPDRIERQDLHPRRGPAGRCRAQRSDRRNLSVHPARPERREGALPDHRRDIQAGRDR